MDSVVLVLEQLGLTLAIGSSTFAVVFYFAAITDRVIDPSERRFMHIAYRVLRIGLGLIVATSVFRAIEHYTAGDISYFSTSFWFLVFLLLVIIGNATAMTYHRVPMWLGPALAGGSWYAYFFIYTLRPTTLSFFVMLAGYVLWIAIVVLVFRVLRSTVEGSSLSAE